MRTFTCPNCHHLVFFENSRCLACRSELGFLPATGDVVAVVPGDPMVRRCANAGLARCNWLLGPDDPGGLCAACRLTRTRPADDDVDGLAEFAEAEQAKRRLVYQLADLGLPLFGRDRDPEHGLAFDLLSSRQDPVKIGHADGVVTMDLAEGRDPHREAMRVRLGEPYRTLLGHFRHEIGHYYWGVLVRGETVLQFRDLFGDERADYSESLDRHYDDGPAEDWPERFVSAYATMHPWEDWAETFAHYLHMRDTIQTAAAFDVRVGGPVAVEAPASAGLAATPRDDLAEAGGVQQLVDTWLPLTYALNAINRSMGKDDLYPFVIPPAVVRKLDLVHRTVAGAAGDGC